MPQRLQMVIRMAALFLVDPRGATEADDARERWRRGVEHASWREVIRQECARLSKGGVAEECARAKRSTTGNMGPKLERVPGVWGGGAVE